MLTTKGKHKQGDRGSNEEEGSLSKRANMAATPNDPDATFDDENLETNSQPTRAELKT